MRRAYIFLCMKPSNEENVVGALALALADGMRRGMVCDSAVGSVDLAALTLLRHEPGLRIETLRRAMGLSHPGAVRMVDRLQAAGLLNRGADPSDRRAVVLSLSDAGLTAAEQLVSGRGLALQRAMASLQADERQQLARLATKMLTALVTTEAQAYEVCRLCDAEACAQCPVEAALS